MKKTLILVGIVILLVVGIGGYFLLNKDSKDAPTSNSEKREDKNKGDNDNMVSNEKALVLYFSATGTTEKVAELIADVTGGKLVEIVPKEKYTSDDLSYNNDNCRANKEQNDSKARPKIENEIDIEGYDTIYIGYPIWWGTNPRIIQTLLDTCDFDGKDVALFATSGGSSISQSEKDLKAYKTKMNVLGSKLFNGTVSNSDVESWIKSLNK